MRINRETLLRSLESVRPGLSTRELTEQSSCLVFRDGLLMTYNDEVACYRESPLPALTGAVKAKPLLDLLSKMPDDDVVIEADAEKGELTIKGKGRKAGVRMEAEVLLQIDTVERPDKWQALNPDFIEAVSVCSPCAASEDSMYLLTCVHIHPDYVEACDRFQLARYPLATGVQAPTLVRAESLRKILPLKATMFAESPAWMHYRNEDGLVMSVRRDLEEYKDLSPYLSPEGMSPVTMPGGLESMVAGAEMFSRDNTAGPHVSVRLTPEYVQVTGSGVLGWYKERKPLKYAGDPIEFFIAPQLLVRLSETSTECLVDRGRLLVDMGRFVYITCTTPADEV